MITSVCSGSACASRLSASVVLRVNRMLSSSRAPTGPNGLTRCAVGLGAHERCEAGAPVHAAVPLQHLADRALDGDQRGRARGVVEVHVGNPLAGDERHLKIVPDDVERGRRGVVSTQNRTVGSHVYLFVQGLRTSA